MNLNEILNTGELYPGISIGMTLQEIIAKIGNPTDYNAVSDRIVYYDSYELHFNELQSLELIRLKILDHYKIYNHVFNLRNYHVINADISVGEFIYILQLRRIQFSFQNFVNYVGEISIVIDNGLKVLFSTDNDKILYFQIGEEE